MWLCEPSQHVPDHGPVQHRLATLGLKLVIFTEPAVLAHPGKGAFYDPALGKHDKAFLVRQFVHDFELPPVEVGGHIF